MYFTCGRQCTTWPDTLASLGIGPLSHLQLRVRVPGGATGGANKDAGGAASGSNPNQERYCDTCSRSIKLGKGGEGNWTIHMESPAHRKGVSSALQAAKTKQITNYFSTKPSRTVTSTLVPPTTQTSLSSNSEPVPNPAPIFPTSRIPDVELPMNGVALDLNPLRRPISTDPCGALLGRLRVTISTLPTTIPIACDTDLLAQFSVNPVMLIGCDQDPWEDVIHRMIDTFTYEGGRPRDSLQLSQFIRRGELGMTGFANWVESCFFQLNIPLGMLEPRIDHIIHAMILLSANTVVNPSVPPIIRPHTPPSAIEARTVSVSAGCPGQDLPSREGKPSFLSYPLGLHTQRELPWNVEFGEQLIIRSHDCKHQSQVSGVPKEVISGAAQPPVRLIRNQKREIELGKT
ncbi:hypothetical protein B0H10DRAFT_1949035 [Mycena sp. CBHHK59/15]|nr:hypothetical protein B0H10DRAFT_1949035 [Mycena sp. CBHHK59/15]